MQTTQAPKLIGEFLNELNADPDLLAEYRNGQSGRADVLTRSGLTAEQREILLSDDARRITDAIRTEYASAASHVMLVHIPCNLPGPDNGSGEEG